MHYKTILFNIDEKNIATIILNKPDIHNAFDDLMISELIHVLQQLNHHPMLRVLVLRANGKNFCAGADLNWMKKMASYSESENLADSLKLAELMYLLNHFPKPVIGLVQGNVFGGGVGLVACCDIVIAEQHAKFCLSEVKLGLIPAVISPYVLNKIAETQARRYFLTAEMFSAELAKQFGLVHELVLFDEFSNALENILTLILANGTNAVSAAKQLIFDVNLKAIDETILKLTAEKIANLRVSGEAQERLKKFLSKV